MSENAILVVADASRPTLGTWSRELLALGRSLAEESGGNVYLVPLGGEAAHLVQEAGEAGADHIYRVSEAESTGYQPELFTAVVVQACRELAPKAVLLTHSSLGLDLAPRLAFQLESAWASGCCAAVISEAELVCTRTLLGGKVLAVEAYSGTPVIVTLRAKSVEAHALRQGAVAELVERTLDAVRGDPALTFLERTALEAGAVAELERAEIIVSAGRGIGSEEGVAQLRQLAEILGGSLGASKAVVDRGWIAADRQIGLTGTTVAPRLYIAVGISGAIQHYVGCSKSKVVVAINNDPDAPIFRFAHYGVVAEWEKVLPILMSELCAQAGKE